MASYAGFKFQTAIHPKLTLIAASGEYAVVRSACWKYDGATSGTIWRAWLQRYNSDGVTPTDGTTQRNTRTAAARVPAQTWATGPTALGNPIVLIDAGNRTGPMNRWTAPRPYAGIYIVDAGEIGLDDNGAASNGQLSLLGWSEHDPGIEGRHSRGRRVARGRGLQLFASYYTSSFQLAITEPKTTKSCIHCFDSRHQPGYMQPQDFDLLLLAGGAATYAETGALLAGSVQAAADIFEASETGATLAGSLEAGADSFQPVETGAILTKSLESGADAFTSAETGALLAASLLAGADASSHAETGALLAASLLAAADAADHSRAGSVLAGGVLSGADVFIATETGSLLAKSLLAGADVATFTETGAALAGAILSGADAFVDVETGKVLAGSVISGASAKLTAGKAGSLLSGSALSGADAVERSRFGSLLASAIASGGDAVTFAEAASLLAGALLAGGKVRISVKSGALLAGTFLGGETGRQFLPGLEGFVVLIRADASVAVIGIEAETTGESAVARAQATFASADTRSIEAEGKTRRA